MEKIKIETNIAVPIMLPVVRKGEKGEFINMEMVQPHSVVDCPELTPDMTQMIKEGKLLVVDKKLKKVVEGE